MTICYCNKEIVDEQTTGPIHEPTDNMHEVHDACLMEKFRKMKAEGKRLKPGKWLPLAYELYEKANEE